MVSLVKFSLCEISIRSIIRKNVQKDKSFKNERSFLKNGIY